MKGAKPIISLVIPVYNSESCLEELNREVEKSFSNFVEYEMILINDKSKDKSWEKIKEICAVNPKVTGISLRKNFGQDNAIMAGLRIVKGDYVVIMDDDLQHSPSDIFKLYYKCLEGFDVCYADFSKKKQNLWKNVGSWLNGKLSEKLLSKPAEVYLSPFKIIKKEVIDEVINFKGPYPYLDASILTVTSNLAQIKIEHNKRFGGIGNYNLLKSVSVFLKHATSYSVYPLRIASFIGVSASLFSFIIAGYYLAEYFFKGENVEGWISLMIMLIFFGGLILMSLGLIGEYIGRIFLSINSKPQYTIEKIISSNNEN